MKNLKQGALTSFFSRSDKKRNPEISQRSEAAPTTPSIPQNGSRDLKKARTLTDMQRRAESGVKMEDGGSIEAEIKVEDGEPEVVRNKRRLTRKEESDDSEFDLSELQGIIDESEASAYSEESAKKRKTMPAAISGAGNSRKSGLIAQRKSQATP